MNGGTDDDARWEQRYRDDDLPWDCDDPDEHLRQTLAEREIAPCRVLDIGCGTGNNAVWLAGQGFEVVGVDLSPTAVARAQQRAKDAGVSCDFVAADFLASSELPGGFEFVYDRGCFHVFDDHGRRARFAERLHGLLIDDGMWHSLIGSTDGPPRDVGPPRRSAVEIITAVEPFFEVLSLRSTVFDSERHRNARAWVMQARRRQL